MKRLALHACCGPCLLEPLDSFLAEWPQTTVVYYNPNIHPFPEYDKRRHTLVGYAREAGVEVVELEYEPAAWSETAGVSPREKADRCRACYRLRLGRVARWAAGNGFDAFATTLTVSPYQDADAIAEEGERAAREAGVVYVARDFRDRYPEATRRSRELGMYRQNYCGCFLSDEEAHREREERRRSQKAAGRPKG